MNRPRPSVLAQFDPLLSEDSPPYLSDSDQESDPDKENNAPERNELTMTAFFKRTYKRDHSQPVILRRRLVDVGDMTVSDVSPEGDEADGEQVDLNDENGAEDNAAIFSVDTPKRPNVVRNTPHTPRTPLAEIILEHDPMPEFPRKKPYTRSLPKSISQPPEYTHQPSAISSLSSLVDAVNLAGTSFGQTKSTSMLSTSVIQQPSNNSLPPPPKIKIDSSEVDHALQESIIDTPAPFTNSSLTSSATKNLSEASDLSLRIPRSTVTTTSSSDPTRLSLDLQASFQLHLQSETSFDLLNDRISFFETQEKGMASFLNALDDESFHEDDVIKQDKPSTPSSLPSKDTTPVPVTRRSVLREPETEEDNDTTPTQDPKTCRKEQSRTCESPGFPLEPSEAKAESLFAPLIARSNALVTPAISRTCTTTVPALRVMKRTKRYDDERPTLSASSSSADSTSSATSTAASVDTSRSSTPASAPAAPLAKPIRSTSALPAKTTALSTAPVVRPGGPMRVPAIDSSGPSVRGMPRPPIPKLGNAFNATGPRRVLLPESSTQSSTASMKSTVGHISGGGMLSANGTASTALKAKSAAQVLPRVPPSRGVASGVPRSTSAPMSRLPAPSGIARLGRKATSASISEARNDVPTRGLPRRFVSGQ